METDRIKWNRRFGSEDTYLGERPSPFLAREIERIRRLAPGKRALDIACGEGRNSVFLAQQGFLLTALDISDVGLGKAAQRAAEAGVAVVFQQVDLDAYRFTEQFDLIINFNFLLRGLIPGAVQALSPGGLLIIGNMNETPMSNLWPMEFIADWTLYYRNEPQMLAWADGLNTAKRWTETDTTGRVRLLYLLKP